MNRIIPKAYASRIGATRTAGFLVTGFGFAVLIGWRFDIPVLYTLRPGMAAMNPATAICFMLAGICLCRPSRPGSKLDFLFPSLASIIVLVGISRLLDHFMGWGLELDKVLFRGKVFRGIGMLPNQMDPVTALDFILLGITLLIHPSRKASLAIHILTVTFSLVSLLVLMGYFYGVWPLHGFADNIPMALHTAVCFLVLGIGILAAYPDQGLAGMFRNPGPGGIMARRLMPAVVILPILLGWAKLMGENLGYYHKELGLVMLMLLTMGAAGTLLFWSTRLLDRADHAARTLRDIQKKNDELYRAVFDGGLDACFIFQAELDAQGLVSEFHYRQVYSNGQERLEMPGANMLGKGMSVLFPSDRKNGTFEKYARIFNSGTPLAEELEMEYPGLKAKWIHHQVIPLSDGIAIVTRDITERKSVQQDLERAKLAAEKANRAKSEFLSNMSHELRTPLNSVIGFSNVLIKNKPLNLVQNQLSYLDRIQTNGKHLLGLINDILDLSKIEAGKSDLEWSLIDLWEWIPPILSQFEVAIQGRPVRLIIDIPANTQRLRVDAGKLRQVILNLVSNALKFTQKGEIRISLEIDSRFRTPLRLRVRDTGIGIPAEQLESVFEAFQQADSGTARRYGGTGLGLTISRTMLELMGFGLSVRSEIGEGSVFSIDFQPAVLRNPAAGKSAVLEASGR